MHRARVSVTEKELAAAIRTIGVAGRPVGLHSSLSSFGKVGGGADAVVDAFLAEGCTLLVPAFSFDANAVDPPPGSSIDRNGWDYSRSWFGRSDAAVYTTDSSAIDRRMGAVPAAVVRRHGRARGDHPMCSFAALGPTAADLIASQTPEDVFAPLAELALRDGSVVLAGVDLNRMTLLHLAEQRSGRRMFVRWAADAHGKPLTARVGGCSEGFVNLRSTLSELERATRVGTSTWRVYAANAVLDVATDAIRRRPEITRCEDVLCTRCRDAVRGGPEI